MKEKLVMKQGKKLAEDEKILFEEISALGAINVENAFHNALEDLYQKVLAKKQKN